MNDLIPKALTPMDCTMTREQLIVRIGILAETHLMALRNTVENEVFESVADFPVELINNTINGYQRFLRDVITPGGESGNIVAGMILRFKAALVYEFGKPVMQAFQDEIFTKMTDQQFTDAHGKDNMPTLWSTSTPKLDNAVISSDFDMLATYLFINHAKWLVVRVGAALDEVKK